MFLGNARRKVGDIVLYRRNGKQVTRIRVTPSNPKSEAQCRTRMAFSTCASAAATLKPIVNHSFENIKQGAASVNHFTAINMPRVRDAAWHGIEKDYGGQSFDIANFLIKGAKGCAFFPFQISRGSLLWKQYECSDGYVQVMGVGEEVATLSITDAASYRQALQALGVAPGEQLSIVLIVCPLGEDGPVVQAAFGDAVNYYTSLELYRIIFKTEDAVDFSAPFTLISDSAFAPQVVNYQKTSNWINNIEVGVADIAQGVLGLIWENSLSGGIQGYGVGVVRSSYDAAAGKWHYSTAFLSWFDPASISNEDDVWPSYSKASKEAVSDLYLQQADNMDTGAPSDAPFAPPVLTLTPAEPVSTESDVTFTVALSKGAWSTEQGGNAETLRIVVNGSVLTPSLSSSIDYNLGAATVVTIARGQSGSILDCILKAAPQGQSYALESVSLG